MAHFSLIRVFLALLLMISFNSAFAEFDEVYWELNGQKFNTPRDAYMSFVNGNNANYGNCQQLPLSAARWELLNVSVSGNNSSATYRVCSYKNCNLDCSSTTTQNLWGAVKKGVCKPGRVYNPYTYQCQDQCQEGSWQDVDSRPGLGWQVTGLYGCNAGCLVRYDAYTDLANFSTNVRARRWDWMCSSDYCLGSEQTSTQCGYHYSCPDGFVLNGDGSCGSQQCPAGTVSDGAGGCRQECAVDEIWDGNSCVLPACPLGQHREDGACVDNQCPAGQIQDPVTKNCINPDDPAHQCPAGTAKNLNGECGTDSDGDGKPDDSDGDGTPDSEDNDDDNDGTPDWGDSDSDGDGDIDPPNCPEGTTANQYGNCIADGDGDGGDNPGDGGDNPPPPSGDGGDNPPPPSGDGGNTPPPSDGSGGGSGDGTGNDSSAASSSNCGTAPSCLGDPIQCATLRQVWETGCLVLEPRKSTEPANDVPSQVIDLKTQVTISDSNQGVNFGAACPSDRTVSVIGKSFTISYRQLCEFAVAIRPVVIGVAAVNSARLLVK